MMRWTGLLALVAGLVAVTWAGAGQVRRGRVREGGYHAGREGAAGLDRGVWQWPAGDGGA